MFILEFRLLQNFFNLTLAETDTKHQELLWRKIGHLILNGITQENRKLVLKSSYYLIQG